MAAFSKGHRVISIETIHGFGKNPGLWVGEGNEFLKVASFGSDEKAKKFQEWLEWFFGEMLVKEDE